MLQAKLATAQALCLHKPGPRSTPQMSAHLYMYMQIYVHKHTYPLFWDKSLFCILGRLGNLRKGTIPMDFSCGAKAWDSLFYVFPGNP